MTNILYYGDNLKILRDYIPHESVDLIYLDPPFNSNRNYNVIFREANGMAESQAQLGAFEDTWSWTIDTERALDDLAQTAPPLVVDITNLFVTALGRNDLTAYLTIMTIRLVELHRVLKPTGSMFLHCDPTAGHYLKIILDAIFGKDKLINEISWQRTAPKSHAYTRLSRSRDLIFWYAKSDTWTFNPQYKKYEKEYIKQNYRYVEEETGRRYTLGDVTNPAKKRPHLTYEWKGVKRVWRWTRDKMEEMDRAGRLVYLESGLPRYKRYLDEMSGVPLTDNWTDIGPVQGRSRESLGYPTQKPVALLERIVTLASNPGDIVLDPFCGCGTSIAAAEKLGRAWIGIDITHLAISLIRNRLTEMFPDAQFAVVGEPESVNDARALAEQSRHQFEWWAISLVGARPVGDKPKKGADKGIDGVLYFKDGQGAPKKVIVQVKSGQVGVGQVRDLAHVIDREKAAIGLFISLEEPTRPMIAEAASLGFYHGEVIPRDYPRLQLLTIAGLLSGQRADLPHSAGSGLKRADRVERKPQDLMKNMFDRLPPEEWDDLADESDEDLDEA